jgi:hypothetical protein
MKNSPGKPAQFFHLAINWWPVIILPLAVVLCTLLSIRVVDSMDYHHNDNDFFTFWLAGHLAATGGNPYGTEQWVNSYRQFEMDVIPNHTFLYPLPLAILLAPLGLLPMHTAYIIWVTLLQWMILVALCILLNLGPVGHFKFLPPLLAGLIIFRPTVLTLVQGQMSGVFLLVLVLTMLLMEKDHWALSGALLSLIALKPNIGLPIGILLLVWLVSNKKFASLLGLLVGGLVLLIIGLLQNPLWLVHYWGIGSGKLVETFGGSPTVWGLAALVFGRHSSYVLISGGLVASLLVGGIIWLLVRLRGLSPMAAFALAVTVTLLVTPYTWTYDQLLLLIPIAFITFALGEHRHGFLPAALFFIGLDILSLFLLFFNTLLDVEILNAFIPIIVLGFIFWVLLRKNKLHDSCSPIIQVESP